MSKEEAVPAVPAVPTILIAVSVSREFNDDPNVDRFDPHFILQRRRENEQRERAESSRVRGSSRDRRSRYESCSPPRDREVSTFLANPVNPDYIIGANLEDWQSAIADYREIDEREGTIYTSAQVIEQLLSRFTRLRIERGDNDEEEEDNSKYIEAVFVKKSNTYHKIYTGKNGGKYFFDVNGQQKYVRPVDRGSIELVDPEDTAVIDTNPVLKTTDVVVR
jgi:hypothetical protein